MTNLTLTIHFCDISQSFVSATKYENTSITVTDLCVMISFFFCEIQNDAFRECLQFSFKRYFYFLGTFVE
jgi:hypothetical protein